MKKLLAGLIEFREVHLEAYRQRYEKQRYGQAPDVVFITCSDSRVSPNWYVSTDPGELFEIKNLGNIVPAYHRKMDSGCCAESAEIEHAFANFPIEHIVVCGHSECTAMQAIALGLDQQPGALSRWLRNTNLHVREGEILNEDGEIKGDFFSSLSLVNKLAQLNVLHQMHNLRTIQVIADKIANQDLKIHGWYFDLISASIYSYREKSQEFILLGQEGR